MTDIADIERTGIEHTFDGRISGLLMQTLKNKFVKKPTHSNAQNTLSFFLLIQKLNSEKNERVFSPPHEKQKTKTKNSPENGAAIF